MKCLKDLTQFLEIKKIRDMIQEAVLIIGYAIALYVIYEMYIKKDKR